MSAAYLCRVCCFFRARGRRAAWTGLARISFLLVAFPQARVKEKAIQSENVSADAGAPD